jgi:regulator of sigma E protease
MDIWIKAAQFILSLSLLVILHEFGHFIPAKLFKTRVEKFYLFFNPWFSIFKRKVGETEWGIGWLPLGGFVKIAGMVDESMDKEQLAQPAQPWEFRSKPAWQRLIIMIGGVVVNVILGLIIYIGVTAYYGEERLDPAKLKDGLAVHPYLKKYGIVSGDEIISVDGEKTTNVMEVSAQVLLRGAQDLEVKKPDGKIVKVHFPEEIPYELFEKGAFPMVSLRTTSLAVDSVLPASNATKAGFKKGDQFLTINGANLHYFDDIQLHLFENKGKKIEAQVLRGKDTVAIKATVTPEGTLGYVASKADIIDEASIVDYKPSFGESIGLGYKKGMNTLQDYAGQLKFMFTKKGATSIGGFARMGDMFPPTWDWHIFWLNTAFLSLALAIMNILPIPALDGGHVVFLLYEIVTGKEAPQKVLEYAQYVGIFLLLGLMLYANGNDVYRIFFK